MSRKFLYKQIEAIKIWGLFIIFYKIWLRVGYILALPIVVLFRVISPWLLVRIIPLNNFSMHHFITDAELFLCEQKAGMTSFQKPCFDIFCMNSLYTCNSYLALMWKRVLRVYPGWILLPIINLCAIIPGGKVHIIERKIASSATGRDVNNLFSRFPAHLSFTEQEKILGQQVLRKMGIPENGRFVCLIVRDSAYFPSRTDQFYRNSDIQNYCLAADEVTKQGYFVIRMGAKVNVPMKTSNPKIIDYATNGMRTEFMDIYLGANCEFCITSGTGWDAVPMIFRKPLCYVNLSPVGLFHSWLLNSITIFKHHILLQENRELTLEEIFQCDVEFCMSNDDYESKGIKLIENTSEEICDVTIEMLARTNNTLALNDEEDTSQQVFWKFFTNALDKKLDNDQKRRIHGKQLIGRIGTKYLAQHMGYFHRKSEL